MMSASPPLPPPLPDHSLVYEFETYLSADLIDFDATPSRPVTASARSSFPVPRSAAAVRGDYGIESSAVASAPGVQGRAEGGAVTVPLSAVAGPGLRSAMAVEARALVHAGVGELPEATRRPPRIAHGRLKVGQVASTMNTGVLWLGGQVATREADVERCVGIGTGQGKCLRRGKPRPVPSRREAYQG
jgi:hypothetical protein